MKSLLKILLLAELVTSGFFMASAGDDLAATQAAFLAWQAEQAAPKPRVAKMMALQSSSVSKYKTYVFEATGDLNRLVGEGTLRFNFAVNRKFSKVFAAELQCCAYDVDHPEATERDEASFNGNPLGRLEGNNNGDMVNKFTLDRSWVKIPGKTETSANNSFTVAVDVDNGGWVTSISWARLYVAATEDLEVTATDGLEHGGENYPEGIYVSWEDMTGATSFDVYRSEQEDSLGTKIATTPQTSYYDRRATETGDPQPDKRYIYTVKANTGVEGKDDGLCDGEIPKIVKLEFPEFWLENHAPMKMYLNDFNADIYKFENVSISVGSRKIGIAEESIARMTPSAIHSLDFAKPSFADRLSWHNDEFGPKEVSVTWTVKNKKTGKILNNGQPYGPENAKGTIKVYFNKYEKKGGLPNWYYYWPKHGAIDKKFFSGEEQFSFDAEEGSTLGSHSPRLNWSNAIATPEGYPRAKTVASPFSVYKLYLNAPTLGRTYTLKNGIPVGSSERGIKALAAVITHERRHGSLWKEFIGQGKVLMLGGHHQRSELVTVDDVLEKLRIEGEDGGEYYKKIVSAQRSGLIAVDLDGDGLDDRTEGDWGFGLKPGNPDTLDFHLLNKNFKGYAAYGDNEVLARSEERYWAQTVAVDTSKDWAFPGSNRGTYEQHLNSSAWRMCDLKSAADQMFAQFSASGQTRAAKMVVASISEMDRSADSVKGGSWSGGEFGEVSGESSDYAFGGIVKDDTASYGTATGYSHLALTVAVVNKREAQGPAAVEGYLALGDGTPVAWARTEVAALPVGTTNVELKFPGSVLRSVKGTGYRLVSLAVTPSDQGDNVFADSFTANAALARNYASTDFACDRACVIRNGFTDVKSGGNLELTAKVDVAKAGAYTLAATLEDADGVFVASASASVGVGTGLKTVKLIFAGSDIYYSRRNGPYRLRQVSLTDSDGDEFEFVRGLYTTASYAYTDFRPSLSLAPNESSFACGTPERGADGLIDVLPFSFTVSNHGAGVNCRVKAILTTTNGTFVCSTEQNAWMQAGMTTVVLSFRGRDIASAEIDGPYVVSEVQLTPVSGAPDRFFPKMSPVELKASAFGVYPFYLRANPILKSNEGPSTPYVVTVPLQICRAGKVTVSALMVDADGQFVATVERTIEYTGLGWSDVDLAFTERDIQRLERRGPFQLKFVKISSNLPGIEPLRVDEFDGEFAEHQFTRYVWAEYGSDSNDGFSWGTAYQTIQAAVDAAQEGDRILVADGVYAPIDTKNKSIRIESYFGVDDTFIDGQKADRCATLGHAEGERKTVLDGFTLRNGDSTGSVAHMYNCGGGVLGGTVVNCRITGCRASKGGGAYDSNLENCVIVGNEATTYGGGSYLGTRTGCTIVDNTARDGAGGTYSGVTYNSIVWNNAAGWYKLSVDNYKDGRFAWSDSYPQPVGTGNMEEDPRFVNAQSGNYRLMSVSPCLDAGSTRVVTTETDFVGNPRVMGTSVDLGAFERMRSVPVEGTVQFAEREQEGREGETLQIEVFGGSATAASSAKVYLQNGNGTVADVVTSKKFGFPLTLTWAAGEVASKTFSLPLLVDSAVEGDETFYLVLESPTGVVLGDEARCKIKVVDTSTGKSLAQALGLSGLKATTSGTGKWVPRRGNAYVSSNDSLGLSHVETSAIAAGKTSSLVLTGAKDKGDMVVIFRFVGATDYSSAALDVLAGKKVLHTYYHSVTGSQWQRYTIQDATKGAHTYTYRFRQGNDPSVRVEMVEAYWRPSSSKGVASVYATTSDLANGNAFGGGVYRIGTKATLTAKANPGCVFKGWYKWSDADGRYVEWTTKASVSFTVTDDFDARASFVRNPRVTALSSSPALGSVSGSAYVSPGKTVKLKATPAKGAVFAGWYAAASGGRLTFDPSCRLSASASWTTPAVTADVVYYAHFVTKVVDIDAITFSLDGQSATEGSTVLAPESILCGLSLSWPIESTGILSTTVSASGLPSGLKLVRDAVTRAYAVSGAPTKTGTFTAKFTVTTAGKNKKTYSRKIVVTPLPEWARGSYVGASTFSITSSGGISGKFQDGGTNWTVKASSYSIYDEKAGILWATNVVASYSYTVKSGKKTVTKKLTRNLSLAVFDRKDEAGRSLGGEVYAWETGDSAFERYAYQNVWGRAYKSLGAVLFKKGKQTYVTYSNVDAPGLPEGAALSLKITTSGAVTAVLKQGKKSLTWTTTVVPQSAAELGAEAFSGAVYLGFPSYSGWIDL